MKGRKKLLPVWLIISIDILLIAAYIGSFYGLYYMTPRQLKSSGIKIVQQDISTASQSVDTDISEASTEITQSNETDTLDHTSQTSDNDNSDDASITAKPSDSMALDDNSKTTDTTETSETLSGSPSDTKSPDTETTDNKTSDTKSANTKSSNTKTSNSNTTSKKTSTAKVSSANKTASSTKSSASSWANKFANKFTDKVVSTATSYSSSDISITVKKQTQGTGSNLVTYYVADIYIADIKCLQSGFADNTYGIGYTEDVLSMDNSFNALLTINGDYYGNGGNGVVIRNGEAYRMTTSNSDVCVLYYNGKMKTFSADEFDVNQAIKDGAYQAWCFGPKLLDKSGNALTDFVADGHVKSINPRSAIGYYEPGHYCMVVVDGRQRGYSSGLTLVDFSSLFEKLGCSTAYNLDGGKSSEMTFNDAFVNKPCDGGREVSDCIFIKEVASK